MEDTPEDFDKKWTGTFFTYNDVVYYGLGWTKYQYTVMDINAGLKVGIKEEDTDKVAPWFPKMGLYNLPTFSFPVFIGMVGNRQWKRGCCAANTTIQSVLGGRLEHMWKTIRKTHKTEKVSQQALLARFALQGGNDLNYKIDAGVVREIVKHTYPNFYEALNQLNKRLSVAISPELLLQWSLTGKGIHLYYYEHRIGEVSNGLIQVTDPIFKQEVDDFLRRNQVNFKTAA